MFISGIKRIYKKLSVQTYGNVELAELVLLGDKVVWKVGWDGGRQNRGLGMLVVGLHCFRFDLHVASSVLRTPADPNPENQENNTIF